MLNLRDTPYIVVYREYSISYFCKIVINVLGTEAKIHTTPTEKKGQLYL